MEANSAARAAALGRAAKAAGTVGTLAGPIVDAVTGYQNPFNQTRNDRWSGAVMGALRGLDNAAAQAIGAVGGSVPGAAFGTAVTAPVGGWGAIPGGVAGATAGGLALNGLYSGGALDRGFNSLVNAAEPGVRSAVGLAERAYDWAAPTVSFGYGVAASALGWGYGQLTGVFSGNSDGGSTGSSN
jgi:hypothetical protein